MNLTQLSKSASMKSELLQKLGHAMLSGDVERSGWRHLATNTW